MELRQTSSTMFFVAELKQLAARSDWPDTVCKACFVPIVPALFGESLS